jgi:hypothetical protein
MIHRLLFVLDPDCFERVACKTTSNFKSQIWVANLGLLLNFDNFTWLLLYSFVRMLGLFWADHQEILWVLRCTRIVKFLDRHRYPIWCQLWPISWFVNLFLFRCLLKQWLLYCAGASIPKLSLSDFFGFNYTLSTLISLHRIYFWMRRIPDLLTAFVLSLCDTFLLNNVLLLNVVVRYLLNLFYCLGERFEEKFIVKVSATLECFWWLYHYRVLTIRLSFMNARNQLGFMHRDRFRDFS